MKKTLRQFAAVFAGLLVTVVLSTATDAVLYATDVFGKAMADRLYAVALAYRIVYGVVGGYVAARIAGERPLRAALVLGVIGLLAGLIGAAVTWEQGPDFGPKWYALAVAAVGLPCAWFGGKAAVRS